MNHKLYIFRVLNSHLTENFDALKSLRKNRSQPPAQLGYICNRGPTDHFYILTCYRRYGVDRQTAIDWIKQKNDVIWNGHMTLSPIPTDQWPRIDQQHKYITKLLNYTMIADLGQPVWLKTVTHLLWLSGLWAQPSNFPLHLCNKHDTHLKSVNYLLTEIKRKRKRSDPVSVPCRHATSIAKQLPKRSTKLVIYGSFLNVFATWSYQNKCCLLLNGVSTESHKCTSVLQTRWDFLQQEIWLE